MRAGRAQKANHKADSGGTGLGPEQRNTHMTHPSELFVAEAYVGKNLIMKRWKPRARGRVGRIEKPFSQITIVVREKGAETGEAA